MDNRSLDDILAEYIEEVDKDFDFNQMNISTVSFDIIKIKHKWVCRLIQAKRELIELDRIKNDAVQKLAFKLSKESDVPLSIPNAEQKALKNDKIKEIMNLIQDQKTLIEYLERIELIGRNCSFDVKNIVELIKMENL